MSPFRSTRGGGLFEMVMTITLVGIVAGMVLFPVVTGISSWNRILSRQDLVAGARPGLEFMVRSLQQMKPCSIYTLGGVKLLFNGTYSSTPPPPPFIFYYVGPTFEYRPNTKRVIFYESSTWYDPENKLGPAKPTSEELDNYPPLIDNVQVFGFEYFDMWNNPITGESSGVLRGEVWRIRITLTVASGGESATLQEEVYPRNFLRENKRNATQYDPVDGGDCP